MTKIEKALEIYKALLDSDEKKKVRVMYGGMWYYVVNMGREYANVCLKTKIPLDTMYILIEKITALEFFDQKTGVHDFIFSGK